MGKNPAYGGAKHSGQANALAEAVPAEGGTLDTQRSDHPKIETLERIEELSEQTQLLAQAVDNSSDLIALANREGHFVFANQAFLQTLGYAKEEMIGKHFSVAFSAKNPPALVQELGAKMYEQSGWKGEFIARRCDGSEFMIFLNVGPVKDSQGRVIGSFGAAQDITERKKAEDALRRSEEKFRELAEHIRVVFFVSTPEPFAITYISPAYDLMWGRPRQQMLERPTDWIEAIHPEDRERVYGVLADSQRGNETYMEYRIVRPDGSIRWISNPAFPVRNAEGKLVRVVGIAEDITDRVEREKSLRDAHERLNVALTQAGQLAAETEKLSELVDVLQSCQTLEEAYKVIQDAMQTTLSSRAGALCITSPSRNIVEAVAFWGEAPGTDKTFRPDDCWALRRGKTNKVKNCDSPLRCAHVSGAPAGGYLCVPLAAQGETLGVLYMECPPQTAKALPGASEDGFEVLGRQAAAVGERISLAVGNLRLRQVLRSQSIRDPLTGLFNRRFMEETLERELSRATRSDQPVALLMMDIDHFKRFNDTFGHQAGDKLLHALGDFVQQRTRGQDVACRYGGEEFAVILSGGSVEAAVKRAELLREDLKHLTVEHAGQILERVTLSIGVAGYPGHGTTSEELVRAADRALYRAKAEGRDKVAVK